MPDGGSEVVNNKADELKKGAAMLLQFSKNNLILTNTNTTLITNAIVDNPSILSNIDPETGNNIMHNICKNNSKNCVGFLINFITASDTDTQNKLKTEFVKAASAQNKQGQTIDVIALQEGTGIHLAIKNMQSTIEESAATKIQAAFRRGYNQTKGGGASIA